MDSTSDDVWRSLVCPHCRTTLGPCDACARCGRRFTRDDGVFVFVQEGAAEGGFDTGTARLVREYERTGLPGRLLREELATMRRRGELPCGRALDLGAGNGFTSLFLQELGLRCDAADATLDTLRELGQGEFAGNVFMVDAQRTPFADATYDFVLCANLLEHVPDPGAVVGEVARIVKPGGAALFCVPSPPALYGYFDRFSGHFRRYSRRGLVAALVAAGFRPTATRSIGFATFGPLALLRLIKNAAYRTVDDEALRRRCMREVRASLAHHRLNRALFRLETAWPHNAPTPPGMQVMCVAEKRSV